MAPRIGLGNAGEGGERESVGNSAIYFGFFLGLVLRGRKRKGKRKK
jgi:hypothetical protein